MFTKEQQDRAIQAAQFQQESARGLEQIFSAFPTLVRCEANSRLIQELCREFMGEDVAPSLDTFRNIIDLNPGAIKSLATQPVERTRHQLVEEILSLLASRNGGRDGKFNDYNLRSEKQRMASWSLDALRVRLAEIKTKQRMAGQSIQQLKQVVADAHADKRRYPGYPELPKSIWNGTTHIPLNAATIKAMDAWEIRRYSRLYGAEQLNNRIRETA